MHIELTREVFHFPLRQINRCPVDGDTKTDDVRRVQHFCEVFRVPVLPPTDARLVRIIDARHIKPLVRVIRVIFLEVPAHPHMPVTERGDRFGETVLFRVKPFFRYFPFIDCKQSFHLSATPFSLQGYSSIDNGIMQPFVYESAVFQSHLSFYTTQRRMQSFA